MRAVLRKTFILGASLVSKPKSGVYILNGHYLSRYSNNKPEIFDDFLKRISKFSRFINIEKANELIISGEAEKINETLIAFTFDDGFDDCFFSLAPVLEKYNVNACFFINPGFVDGDEFYLKNFTQNVVLTPNKKPMSWLQIKSLYERGFIIGNHTFDHIRLSDVSLEVAELQILKGKNEIEKRLNAKCEYFAWPFGQYSDVNEPLIDMLSMHHLYVYSGCDYKNYLSYGGKVLNRRHFEADWSSREMKYFLSKPRVFSK